MLTRLATPEDREGLASLLRQVGAPEQPPPEPDTPERVAEELSAPAGRAGPFCLVAREAGSVLGFAAFSGVLPATGGHWGLFLQLLFVTASARGKGASRALMGALARFAMERGYARIDWNAMPGNAPATALYASLGVPLIDRVYYRVEGPLLARAATSWPEPIR
jgi:GNAT superfamily N-acetyltransferase